MKRLFYIGIISHCIGFLTGCTDDTINNLPTSIPSDGVELTGICTALTSNETFTRGTYNGEYGPVDTITLKDLIGRGVLIENPEEKYIDLEAGDQMVFTSIKRNGNPIDVFSYKGLVYNMTKQGSWTRDVTKGETEETEPKIPEKIYWSDASRGHFFIGYSCPNVQSFDWNLSNGWYYGSLGNPTSEGDINYNDTENGNNLIKADDILLTWADDKVADNAVANIVYHHGLALVRVIVNISGFGANAKDKMTKVENMILQDMPTMYKWDMSNYKTEGLSEGDQEALNSIYGDTHPSWNQKKDVHLWLPVPAGQGDGASKTFTFYALAVPHTANGLGFSFDVIYPDPMKPTENPTADDMIKHTYTATMPSSQKIVFRAGWCTTLKISLNHKNEQMTIGAEYMSWQFAPHPDDGSLKKGEAFLSSSEYDKATYSTQSGITIDNATWLYKDNNILKDIYGNTGTEEAPFVIKTAAQFASFAKEVNEAGLDFAGKYIRMDADFYLQKSIDVTEKGMVWPGIGTTTTPFNGNIIGETRFIRHLYGKPLFINIGYKAHIEQLLLEEVLGITAGTGAYAEVNNGIICASKVTSPNDTPFTMTSSGTVGAFCGTNNGIIVGVYALGEFNPTAATSVGGLIGNNQGILAGAYTAIEITNPENITNISGCVASGNPGAYDFYCSDMLTPKGTYLQATGKTTQQMRSQTFVGVTTETDNPDATTLNGAIKKWAKDGFTIPEAIYNYVENLPNVTPVGVNGTPGNTMTALEYLKVHLSSHYYTYQVASMPWIF